MIFKVIARNAIQEKLAAASIMHDNSNNSNNRNHLRRWTKSRERLNSRWKYLHRMKLRKIKPVRLIKITPMVIIMPAWLIK